MKKKYLKKLKNKINRQLRNHKDLKKFQVYELTSPFRSPILPDGSFCHQIKLTVSTNSKPPNFNTYSDTELNYNIENNCKKARKKLVKRLISGIHEMVKA